MATLSLIAGTLVVAATLTGPLAPLGFVAGVLAVLFGVFAVYAVAAFRRQRSRARSA